MKNLFLSVLILFSVMTGYTQKFALVIGSGEITITSQAGTTINHYKAGQITNFNYSAEKKINLYCVNPSMNFTIDTAKMLSYNGGAVPAYSVILAALTTVTTPTAVTGGALEASLRTAILAVQHDSTILAQTKITIDSLKYKRNQEMGLMGNFVITGTDITNIRGGWCVTALANTVIASLSFTDKNDSLSAVTLPAGSSLKGKFKHIDLTSGSVIVYK
jgi:hypothetical protein